MYPSALETLATDKSQTTPVGATDHPDHHNALARIVNALQIKVGITGSAVTTTVDYQLSEVTGGDKAVSKTAIQTLTNKTLTAPVISTIVNTGTITLPTATDTLVARNTTDTLANKTLTTPTIADFTNATHDHSANSKGGQLNAATVFASGLVPTARLATGVASNGVYLRGDQTWAAVSNTYNYGDGSDSDVTISSPTTLTRDMYYHNLTITSTLTTDGYKVFVSGTLSGAGTIDFGAATAGSNGGTSSGGSGGGGSGGAATGSGQFKTIAGGNGGNGTTTTPATNGSAGASQTSSIGVAGVAGGAGGGTGHGTGGAGGTISILTKVGIYASTTLLGVDFGPTGTFVVYTAAGGAGGGGGGAANSSGFSNGGGGGGGASGGIVFICVNIWAGTFTIKATGANGGNGGTSGSSFGGGGGAGGAGGCAIIIYGTKTWTGSYNLAGGTKGTGTNGGTDGTSGTTGSHYELDINTLTR